MTISYLKASCYFNFRFDDETLQPIKLQCNKYENWAKESDHLYHSLVSEHYEFLAIKGLWNLRRSRQRFRQFWFWKIRIYENRSWYRSLQFHNEQQSKNLFIHHQLRPKFPDFTYKANETKILFQIPDLTSIIDDVDSLIKNDTIRNIQQGKDAFENIRKELNATIARNIPTVTDALNDAGELIFFRLRNTQKSILLFLKVPVFVRHRLK